jgi:EmrB/QacA subfamily drug resistance transporter
MGAGAAQTDERPGKDALDRGTKMAIVALALAIFVVANDFTALSVALPNMEADLDADVGTIQWVINAYALVFGVLIITGGRLADMFGRRRIFFIGAAIFAVFSTLAGAAPNADLLIAGRALMGIGGAMMWPAVLGLTYQVLPESRRGLAGPLILGVAGIGNAFGPMLGGFLTEELSWRWVLFLNLPIAAGACVVTYLKVASQPGDRQPDDRLDYAGVAALSVGLVALLVALDQATDWGWGSPRIVGLLVLCVLAVAAFVPIERRAGAGALIPPDVARNGTFVSACAAVLLMSATFFAILLYIPQVMQKLMGFSALESGVGFLPFMGVFSLVSFAAGPLYERVGGKLLLTAGAACLPVGVFLLSLVGEDDGYLALVPGLVVAGTGVGLFYSTLTTVAVTALEQARASLAGGVLYMFQVAGGSVGLGLTTTVFTAAALSHVRSEGVADQLTSSQEHAVGQILSGNETSQALTDAFPQLAAQLEQLARDALTAGVHVGLRVDTGLALLGFLITLFFVGGRLRLRRESAAAPTPATADATASTAP